MAMAWMRGLELVCIARTRAFEIRYESGRYVDLAGRDVPDLLDMTCFACGAAYYTLDGDEALEFCPNCGRFERMRFGDLPSLLQWSRGQHFGFTRFSGSKVFAVQAGDTWELRFAPDEDALIRRGQRGEIHEVAG
jgi:hypothetical protein